MHTRATGVIGTGLKLHASVDREFLGLSDDEADEIEATIEREHRIWAESQDSDSERTLNFYEQQELAWRAADENGDHFILLTRNEGAGPYSLALQHIEADRCSNPGYAPDSDTLIAGVEKDAAGAPIRYHFSDQHPGAIRRTKLSWTARPAFSSETGRRLTLHLYRKLRTGQTRGVPTLAPVIEPLKQADRYFDAELDAAVKNALWAILVQTETGDGLAGLNYGDWRETRKEFYQQTPVNLKDGSSGVLGLFPDDTVQSFDPSRPNAAFEPFVNAAFSLIGVALELPHEILVKRFQSSYSAARAAIIQAIAFYLGRRVWIARNLCQPVHETLMREAVLMGRIRAPGFLADPMIRAAYCGAEWVGDAFGQIDESKAVGAAADRVAAGFSTQRRETAALTGEDWDKVQRQRAKEIRKAGASGAPSGEPESAEDLDRRDREAATA